MGVARALQVTVSYWLLLFGKFYKTYARNSVIEAFLFRLLSIFEHYRTMLFATNRAVMGLRFCLSATFFAFTICVIATFLIMSCK